VGPNSREEIIAFLNDWFANTVREYVLIADPYFGLDDLEVIRSISEMNQTCKISILTSQHHNKTILDNPKDAFFQRWKSLYNESPPDVEIVMAGVGTRLQSPIHDRWWITEENGLRVGTSYNTLGLGKLSEISKLSPEDAFKKEIEITKYLTRIKGEHNGNPIKYLSFTLN